MTELEVALERILEKAIPLDSETISVSAASGRFASYDVLATQNLPPFDNSAMDGYAVLSSDVKTASSDSPVLLRVIDTIAAGKSAAGIEVQSGTCVRIFTGSPMPKGADAVVMQEDTLGVPNDPNSIFVNDAAGPWENVRFKGEDLKPGTTIISAGSQINTGQITVAAANGIREIRVSRKPSVALLATGSELKEAGEAISDGEIYESNRTMLAELVLQAGGNPIICPIIPDDPESTRSALRKALSENDLVVSTGGVSVGEYDFVKDAFREIGGTLDFWRIRMKPGKPFTWGRWNGKHFFGLPGNPVSALVTFLMLVRPVVLKMQGASKLGLPSQSGRLAEDVRNRGDRRHFVRVFIDEAGAVKPVGTQSSHMISPLISANGLVDVPPDTTVSAGEKVRVLRWQ